MICRASASPRCPRGHLYRGFAARPPRLPRRARRPTACLIGNSMGGFIAAEAVDPRRRRAFERLVLVSAAGHHRRARAARQRHDRRAASVAAIATRGRAARRRVRAAPAARAASRCSFVVRHPERLSAPLALRADARAAGKPRLPADALEAILDATDIRERLAADRAARRSIVWGEDDRVDPRRATRTASPELIPDDAPGGRLARHGPHER